MSASARALALDLTQRAPIPPAGVQAALALMASGKLHRYGEVGGQPSEVSALEAEFAAELGVKYCVALNSCGSAMFVALKAAGVKPGDAVPARAACWPPTMKTSPPRRSCSLAATGSTDPTWRARMMRSSSAGNTSSPTSACAWATWPQRWCGADAPVGFTSVWRHWRYFGDPQTLPQAEKLMGGLCDMWLPLTLTQADCAAIGAVPCGALTAVGT